MTIEGLLYLIVGELLLGFSWLFYLLHREIAPERPAPFFPHPDHRLHMELTCGHNAEPHVIYPGGMSACQDCYARKASPSAP